MKNNQNGILCVFCHKWAHLSCSSVSQDFFLSKNDWICSVCLFKELPNFVETEAIDDDNQHRIDTCTGNLFVYDDIDDI